MDEAEKIYKRLKKRYNWFFSRYVRLRERNPLGHPRLYQANYQSILSPEPEQVRLAVVKKLIRDLTEWDGTRNNQSRIILLGIGQMAVPGLIDEVMDKSAIHDSRFSSKSLARVSRINAADTLIEIINTYNSDKHETKVIEEIIGLLRVRHHNETSNFDRLASIKDPLVAAAIARSLKCKNRNIRNAAMGALRKMGELAVPYFVKSLTHKDVEIRFYAATYLSSLNDMRAVSPLVAVLDEKNIPFSSVPFEETISAHEALMSMLRKCDCVANVNDFEREFEKGFALLLEKGRREPKEIPIVYGAVNLRNEIAKKKDKLTSDKDILLPDRPKPPKRGPIYQQMRRIVNV